ncbi:hypothetical protein C8A01DRAFT_17933 [Parachaetomium inaequale]|uniref:glucan endo-1,3-beta-D-glucosidase n=1 Tax=Parachaetomium inaequale TaxID=2588326 RepID=A0AAN6PC79_9PEZI|nr:hypothetical protein C8A01DRAFT_17933 [Parachaetomium inaequale]
MAGAAKSAVTVRGSYPSQQLCQGTATEEHGNRYCQKVQRITYQNMGISGLYSQVISMDQGTGECTFAPREFSGPLGPFGEPLSLHLRGPLNLKQVAVYVPATPGDKASQTQGKRSTAGATIDTAIVDLHREHRRASPLDHFYDPHAKGLNNGTHWIPPINDHRNHTHGRHSVVYVSWPTGYSHHPEIWKLPPASTVYSVAKRDLIIVTVTSIQVVTVTGPVGSNTTAAASSSAEDSVTVTVTTFSTATPTSSGSSSGSSSSSGIGSSSGSKSYSVGPISGPSSTPLPPPSSNLRVGASGTHQFVRTGYYNAAQQKAEGVMFLGNYGGQRSGKWTQKLGNTLSYLNADGTGGAPNATLLKDTTLLSSHEAALFTDQPCDASCGYVQNGSVAYKGFPGPSRIFLLEFSMPHNTTPPDPGNTTSPGNDKPAIWLLNARIPYTAQYHPCNCHASGCGELDIFEVLSPGHDKAKSTVHSVYSGGDSNYFERPVDPARPVRVAVVFDGDGDDDDDEGKGAVSIIVLGQGEGEFPEGLGRDGVRGLRAAGGDEGEGVGSLFRF